MAGRFHAGAAVSGDGSPAADRPAVGDRRGAAAAPDLLGDRLSRGSAWAFRLDGPRIREARAMNEIRSHPRVQPMSAANEWSRVSIGVVSSRASAAGPAIAVLIPCHNEEGTVATVVRDFQKVLPEAAVYVYDNNSTDRTAQVAASAGAAVRAEPLQGKGNVVRRMFGDIEADIYLLVDGDDTYDALRARELVDLLLSRQLDMVNAARVSEDDRAFRRGHRLGNRVLTALVAMVFGSRVTDMLSGYRAFSRRFVKSFPALSSGFEVETELTVHALELRMKIAEVETTYRSRREGSH